MPFADDALPDNAWPWEQCADSIWFGGEPEEDAPDAEEEGEDPEEDGDEEWEWEYDEEEEEGDESEEEKDESEEDDDDEDDEDDEEWEYVDEEDEGDESEEGDDEEWEYEDEEEVTEGEDVEDEDEEDEWEEEDGDDEELEEDEGETESNSEDDGSEGVDAEYVDSEEEESAEDDAEESESEEGEQSVDIADAKDLDQVDVHASNEVDDEVAVPVEQLDLGTPAQPTEAHLPRADDLVRIETAKSAELLKGMSPELASPPLPAAEPEIPPEFGDTVEPATQSTSIESPAPALLGGESSDGPANARVHVTENDIASPPRTDGEASGLNRRLLFPLAILLLLLIFALLLHQMRKNRVRAANNPNVPGEVMEIIVTGRAPLTVRVGDPFAFRVRTRNPGRGPLEGVRIDVKPDGGIQHTTNVTEIVPIPTLNAGESKQKNFTLVATKPGRRMIRVTSSDRGGWVSAGRQWSINVLPREKGKPQVSLSSGLAYGIRAETLAQTVTRVNKEFKINARITNVGDQPLSDLYVLFYPGDNAQLSSSAGSDPLKIELLRPGEKRVFERTYVAAEAALQGEPPYHVKITFSVRDRSQWVAAASIHEVSVTE